MDFEAVREQQGSLIICVRQEQHAKISLSQIHNNETLFSRVHGIYSTVLGMYKNIMDIGVLDWWTNYGAHTNRESNFAGFLLKQRYFLGKAINFESMDLYYCKFRTYPSTVHLGLGVSRTSLWSRSVNISYWYYSHPTTNVLCHYTFTHTIIHGRRCPHVLISVQASSRK